MKVIARSGLRVPKEHASRQYITDAEAVDVPDTAYYLRRIAEGDLTVENTTAVEPGAKKGAKGA